MPTYQLDNGVRFSSDAPLSSADLEEVAGKLGSPAPASSPADPNADASLIDEGGHAIERAGDAVTKAALDTAHLGVSGINTLLQKAGVNYQINDSGLTHLAGQMSSDAASVPQTVASPADIHTLHDAGLYAANAVGSAVPAAGAAALGGVPAAAVLGGATSADQAYDRYHNVPAAAAAGTLGAILSAAPVPFMRVGAGVVGDALSGPADTAGATLAGRVAGALGNAPRAAAMALGGGASSAAAGTLAGTASGALANVPGAVASGNVSDAVPSLSDIENGAAQGAVTGGLAGAAHGAIQSFVPKAPIAPVPLADPETVSGASADLARRIQSEASTQGLSLKDSDSAGPTKIVLNNVHNTLAQEISDGAKLFSDQLDPQQATSYADFNKRVLIQSTLRDARNKVKSTAAPDGIAALQSVVGGTREGQDLVNAVSQSNILTNLANEGLTGGLSQYVDRLNPFASHHGFASAVSHGSGMGFGALIGVEHPSLIPYAIGGYLAAKGIDAITGRNHPVQRFVAENVNNPGLDAQTQSLPSVVEQRQALAQQQAQEAAQLKQQQEQAAAALQRRKTDLRNELVKQNEPGAEGSFDNMVYQKTGLRPQQARMGVLSLAQSGIIKPEEAAAWFHDPGSLYEGNIGNAIVDHLSAMADQGRIVRDPKWTPPGQASPISSGIRNPLSYAAQANANQARVSDAHSRIDASTALTAGEKETLRKYVSAIGASNNRDEASANVTAALNSLKRPIAKAIGGQELAPLVNQIRHQTKQAANGA